MTLNKEYYMTPLWLKTHAAYIDSYNSIADHQITFNAGALDRALLLKVLLVAAGAVTDDTPMTVEITVANDVSIGESVDSDIAYSLSDGTNFIGFKTLDKANYNRFVLVLEFRLNPGQPFEVFENKVPTLSDKFYPDKFVFTLKLKRSWGSCFTAHDGGFSKTLKYSVRLMLSQGLTLEVYKMDKRERVGIKYIKTTIMNTE